ncbi:30S ribosomal protein S13 [Patescibacteria group bacterium]|nr:30S ribosomal protein S13 [Patescibacteria group bacterium]MBU1472280.1 30S ribosomal protein S13 [Patescibacteria group bacterium]MBU2460469.1 30S ribosomal protein S13 [Patescibacteria group bacterium]MBU2544004.1 30S ribosomal protein S13 [Patescibacteria group bacterium]
MVRIVGVDIPSEKRLDIALTYVYGIGRSSVPFILKEAGIDGGRRVNTLTDEEVNKVSKVIEKKFVTEGDLRRQVTENIKRLTEIRSYRGLRHLRKLPVRGQRTRSNARTRRGKRLTVGALKKEDRAKQQTKETSTAKE